MYYYFNFFRELVNRYPSKMDRGENPFFPSQHYNYFKTKDGKFISVGNLEEKFQINFNKDLNKLSGNGSEYSIEKVKDIVAKLDRDDLANFVTI
jgi:hypothetical protein